MHAFTPCFRGLRITKGAFTTPSRARRVDEVRTRVFVWWEAEELHFFPFFPTHSARVRRVTERDEVPLGKAIFYRVRHARVRWQTESRRREARHRTGGKGGRVLWSLYRVSCARKQWHTAREALVMYTRFCSVFSP